MTLLRAPLVVVSLCIFAFSACPKEEPVCSIGESQACFCDSGIQGSQQCDNGDGWLECICFPDGDAGQVSDAGVVSDANTTDGSHTDSMTSDSHIDDANSEDAGEIFPHPGFGIITGACDVLDTELTDNSPSIFVNHIDFANDPFDDPEDLSLLTLGGQRMISEGNANANSLYSEVFAFEVLARCEDATLLETETSINYDVQGKITDLEVLMDDVKIGVSVVRAMHWPHEDPYTVEEATTHLTGKLNDIQESSANVSAEGAWQKQVLSVIAYDQPTADTVNTAWQALDASVKADTIVVVTISDGDDGFIY